MAKTFILKQEQNNKPLKVDYQSELNKEQYNVVTGAEGPCLVLAGAGSGKTRTIVYRVAYLVEHGIKPENILLVTFTNKAAKEMLQRVESLLGKFPDRLWGGTFHHIGNRLLRKYAKLIGSPRFASLDLNDSKRGVEAGYQSNFTILDEEDSKALLKVCLKEEGIDVKGRRFPSPAVIKDLLSYAKNSQIKLKTVIEVRHPKWVAIEEQIFNVGKRYEYKKKLNNSMDFDDLLVNWLKLLREHTGVRDRLSTQFQYVLVDEYQDTNYIQAEIIKELSSVHHNVLVVGDDAQSIYSFRAANIENILNFPKIFSQTTIFKLETNYRSTPDILGVANQVIENNVKQYPKVLKPILKKFVKPNLVPATSASQEAEFITQQIQQFKNEGIPLNKMAVLFRAAYHSQGLEFELTRRDIPYDFRGGVRFFERAHIKDVNAFLKVITNPKEEVSWMRILGKQEGIGTQTASKIFNKIKKLDCIIKCVEADVSDVLSVRSEIGWQTLVNTFVKDLKVKTIKDLSYPAGFIRAIAISDYRNYLEAEFPNWHERLEDLEQLAIFAERYDDLNSFLSEITLQEAFGLEKNSSNSGYEDRLVLTTIHQAKGLEWEVVFIINLVDSAFPNKRALTEVDGLEEERRLFYVAITRAKKQLFLTYPLTGGYSTMSMNTPSQFLQEVDAELLEEVTLTIGGRKVNYSKFNDGGVQYLPDV